MNFVDTGILLALHNRRDQHHGEAVVLWRHIRQPATSNHVVDELATSLARSTGYGFAADRVQDLYESDRIRVLPATPGDEREALEWMRKYAEQRVSFTDCVSFAMMRRLRIRTAFTFDRHFRIAGFDVIGLK
jgi:uncharacterized protein